LTKPFHPGELLARIDGVLRLRKLQRELARLETVRQTLGALSHHIRNAIQVILTAAEGYTPKEERARTFQETALRQARRIDVVLASLADVVSQGKLRIAEYPGVKEGILDIEEEMASRLSGPQRPTW
jgi:multidrug efflux pump subunit AcrA (membrane-fusion protein)